MTIYHVRITEHTTGEEPYCEVERLDDGGGDIREWFGDADSFIDEIAKPRGYVIDEIVYS